MGKVTVAAWNEKNTKVLVDLAAKNKSGLINSEQIKQIKVMPEFTGKTDVMLRSKLVTWDYMKRNKKDRLDLMEVLHNEKFKWLMRLKRW